ncbi:MAG: HAD family hydrolase [Actinomycetes bacterium]
MAVVGFDLDMTLVDSSEGITRSLLATCELFGAFPQAAEVTATIGLPLTVVFPLWIPQIPYDQALEAYRAHYRVHGIPTTLPMPGAHEAVDIVRSAGGTVLVVSAKKIDFVEAVLNVVAITVDVIVGDLFAEGKGAALLNYGAEVYVGDHPGDMVGARTAGAAAVGVSTGPASAEDLWKSGADVVLASLVEFPGWLGARIDRTG